MKIFMALEFIFAAYFIIKSIDMTFKILVAVIPTRGDNLEYKSLDSEPYIVCFYKGTLNFRFLKKTFIMQISTIQFHDKYYIQNQKGGGGMAVSVNPKRKGNNSLSQRTSLYMSPLASDAPILPSTPATDITSSIGFPCI